MAFFKNVFKGIGKAVKFVGKTAGKVAKVALPAALSFVPGVGNALAGGVSSIIGGSGGDPPLEPVGVIQQFEEKVGDFANGVAKKATDGLEIGLDSKTKTLLIAGAAAIALVLLVRK